MAKAKRKQKLKVYSTPVGFHDALVAAPSQKAALEAWGADSDLFAQGSAEVVEDPRLAEAALEHPGQVVKVLRGTKAEQVAALKKAPAKANRRKSTPAVEVVPKKSKKRPPKPSRNPVERAEKKLETVENRQSKELEAVEKQQRALEQRIRQKKRDHERERDKAQKALEEAQSKYQAALRRYEGG